MKNQYLIPLVLFIAFLQFYFIPSWIVSSLPPPNQIVFAKNGESFEVSKLYLEESGICFVIAETEKFHCLEYAELSSLEVKESEVSKSLIEKLYTGFIF